MVPHKKGFGIPHNIMTNPVTSPRPTLMSAVVA